MIYSVTVVFMIVTQYLHAIRHTMRIHNIIQYMVVLHIIIIIVYMFTCDCKLYQVHTVWPPAAFIYIASYIYTV